MIRPVRGQNGPRSRRNRIALDAVGSVGLLIVLWMIGNTNQYQTSRSGRTAAVLGGGSLPGGSAVTTGQLFGKGVRPEAVALVGGVFLWNLSWHYPVIVLTSLPWIPWGGSAARSVADCSQCRFGSIVALFHRRSDPLQQKTIRAGRTSSQGWRKRILPLTVKTAVSVMLILLVFFVTSERYIPAAASAIWKKPGAWPARRGSKRRNMKKRIFRSRRSLCLGRISPLLVIP